MPEPTDSAAQARSTTTGAWSEAPWPARSSRSMKALVTRAARGGEAGMLGIFASIAEWVRATIRERQADDIAAAKEAGKYKARVKALNAEQVEQARERVTRGCLRQLVPASRSRFRNSRCRPASMFVADRMMAVQGDGVLDSWKLKKAVFTLLVGGLLAALLGMVIVYAAWPDTVLVEEGFTSPFGGYSTDDEYEDTGSSFFVFVGALIALAGQIAAAVATIALGVRLGTREQ